MFFTDKFDLQKMRAGAKKLSDREVAADRFRTWHVIRRLITPQEDHAAVREGQEGLEIEITEGMTGGMLASESEADDPDDKDIAELDIEALPSEGSNSEAEENDGMEFVADDGRIIDLAIGVPSWGGGGSSWPSRCSRRGGAIG